MEGEVLASNDGDGAELAHAAAHERATQYTAVDVLHQDRLEERMHFSEIRPHFVRHGPVHSVEGCKPIFPPGVNIVVLVKMLGSLRVKSELMDFDQCINGPGESC